MMSKENKVGAETREKEMKNGADRKRRIKKRQDEERQAWNQ